jgi:hypothetical protein
MEIFWGIAGMVLGSILTVLARYRRKDIDLEKGDTVSRKEHERDIRFAFASGYAARIKKEQRDGV